MGKISLIIPEATANIVENPSLEINTTGWVAINSAIARVTTEQKFGVACVEVITDNVGANEGARPANMVIAAAGGVSFTGSAWVKGNAGGTVYLRLRDVTNGVNVDGDTVTLTSEWQRVSATNTLGAASVLLQLRINTAPQQGITFYMDAVQVEERSTITTYCDGDQPGCEWLGAEHDSISSRSAQSRAGGTVVDLDNYDITVDTLLGFEMPPLRHNVHNLSLQPGAFLQSMKVLPRVLQLVGHTDTETESTQYTALQNLINAFKEDRVATLQPVILRYTGTATTVEIGCYYDSGLEGSFRCDSHMRFTMRLIAYEPFWQQIGETAEELDTNDETALRTVLGRVGPLWDVLGPPSTGNVMDAVAIGLNGLVYYGGSWLNHDGKAGADYIAQWNPVTEAWGAVAAGGTGRPWDMAVGPDGTLYIVGNFINWNGIAAADYIVTWDEVAYAAVAAGGTGQVYAIAIDNIDGSLYLGGFFLNWNAIATADYIVKYDVTAGAWASITAAGAADDTIDTVAVAPDGTLYAGGRFLNIGGIAANRIAQYDGTNWTAMGTGMDTDVDTIAVALDGTVYAGGIFTTAGGNSAIGIAKWDGVSWTALGESLTGGNAWVQDIKVADNGDVIAVGDFTMSGTIPLIDIARWNGHTWSNLGITLGVTSVGSIALGFYDPVIPNNYDIYAGLFLNDRMESKGLTTITNDGTASAFPRITITRTGGTSALLQAIRNETTGLEMLFNLSLLDGETITIDLAPGNKTVQSSWRGNVIGSLLPNSDFATFALIPGDNEITIYVADDGEYDEVVVTAHIIWRDQYWSVSGAE